LQSQQSTEEEIRGYQGTRNSPQCSQETTTGIYPEVAESNLQFTLI